MRKKGFILAGRLVCLAAFSFNQVLPGLLPLLVSLCPSPAGAADVRTMQPFTATRAATFKSSTTFNNAALFKASVTLSGISATPVSPANRAVIYFDSDDNTLKASENGGAYFDFHAWTLSGSNLYNTAQPQNVLVNTVTALSTFTVVGGVSVSTSATAGVLFFVHASSGAVGIATVNPTERLEVNGNIRAVRYIGDGSQLTNVSGVPANAIAFFDGACPTGWTELATAQGRFLVGNPSGGTAAGTLGTAFANLANASYDPAGSLSAPVFTGTPDTVGAEAAHTHGMQAHTHTTDVTSFNSVAESAHTHTFPATGGPSNTNVRYGNGASPMASPTHTHAGGTTSAGSAHTHAVDLASTASGGPSVANTAAGSSHSHSFTPAGSVAAPAFNGTLNSTMRGVIAPYIQLRLCKKTSGATGVSGDGWQDTGPYIVENDIADNVGIGVGTPASKLTIGGGALQMNATASPGGSTASTGRIYFDSTANKFKVSENTGAYVELVPDPAVTMSGTAGYIPKFTAATTLGNSLMVQGGSDIGIGRAPGAVGAAKLELYGADSSLAGPHLQAVASVNDYPVFQQLNYAHDNISLMFDAYYDGSWRSSDAGSNFRIRKNVDYFRFDYAAGYAAGAAVTWGTGLILDSAGRVGVGTVPNATVKLHVDGKLRVDNAAVSVSGTDMFFIPAGAIMLFDGSACPAAWTEVTSARNRVVRGWDGVTAAGDANVGGANTHDHTTNVALFTSGAEGAHTHTDTTGGPSATFTTYVAANYSFPTTAHTHSFTTGAGSSHTHSADPAVATSSTDSNLPAYRAFLFCKKD